MSGGRRPLRATFWLLEAPDSLAEQSRRYPDGYGIGTFEDGVPEIAKRPAAARPAGAWRARNRFRGSRRPIAASRRLLEELVDTLPGRPGTVACSVRTISGSPVSSDRPPLPVTGPSWCPRVAHVASTSA